MATAIAKVCKVCGTDVSAAKRTKNSAGDYFCEPCVTRLRASAGTPVTAQPSVPIPVPESPPIADNSVQNDEGNSLLSRLWAKKNVRFAVMGGGPVVVGLIALFWYAASFNADLSATIKKDEAASLKYGAHIIQQEKLKAEQLQREIDRTAAEAAALRKRSSTPGADSVDQTKTEAIKNSLFISALIGEYPEFDQLIRDGGTRLDSKLNLMVSSGLLSVKHCETITSFSKAIQGLPD